MGLYSVSLGGELSCHTGWGCSRVVTIWDLWIYSIRESSMYVTVYSLLIGLCLRFYRKLSAARDTAI